MLQLTNTKNIIWLSQIGSLSCQAIDESIQTCHKYDVKANMGQPKLFYKQNALNRENLYFAIEILQVLGTSMLGVPHKCRHTIKFTEIHFFNID